MASFTAEEKKQFRFRKYIKEKAGEYVIKLAVNVLLTEAVVCLCGGSNFLRGAMLAAAYTIGGVLYDIRCYKKEWLDVDIKENR